MSKLTLETADLEWDELKNLREMYEGVKIQARIDRNWTKYRRACVTVYKIDKELEKRPKTTMWGTNKTFDTGS